VLLEPRGNMLDKPLLTVVNRAAHNFFFYKGGGNQEENCLTFFEIVESVAV